MSRRRKARSVDRKEFFKRITDLIKQEEFEKARLALKKYLRQNPKDPQAWYLRSFVVPEREKKIEALQRAFWLEPSYTQAQERLDDLLAQEVSDIPPSAGRRLWRAFLQVLILLLIGALIALGIYAYIDANDDDDEDTAGAATETATPDADATADPDIATDPGDAPDAAEDGTPPDTDGSTGNDTSSDTGGDESGAASGEDGDAATEREGPPRE